MGLGFPVFIVGVFFAIRFLPDSVINLPRRGYWLAPERRAATFAYAFRHSFWIASMLIGLSAGVEYLTLQANRQGAAMAHLSTPALALTGCFFAGTVVWIVCMFRRFR